MTTRISPKQQAFVDYYLANGNNATQAALAAGYSPKTAQQQGSRLLLNVVVSQQVDDFNSAMAVKSEINRDYLNGRLRVTMDQSPLHAPSHAEHTGAILAAAKVNGLIVDKTEITGEVTFEGFKRRMATTIEAQKNPRS